MASDQTECGRVTQVPWSEGKCVTWDMTVTDTLATSNVNMSSSAAGSAAEFSASKKTRAELYRTVS
jgi:hypothetical protein